MSQWLINEIIKLDGNKSNHHFATLGTINWMTALRIYCEKEQFEYQSIKEFYKDERPSNSVSIEQEVSSFQHFAFAVHNLFGLKELKNTNCKFSVVRSAIISWYYCIYYGTKSMVVASTGNDAETHAKVANMFQADLVDRGKILEPFYWNIESLIPKEIELIMNKLKQGNRYNTNHCAKTKVEAKGVLLSYLNGTAKRKSDIAQDRIKTSQEFKDLGVDNFMTNKAREIRDRQLKDKKANFLDQSFRFRGKANYRDAIYLTLDNNYMNEAVINQFIEDMIIVANSYTKMSYEFVRKNVRKTSWNEFINDFDKNNVITFNSDTFMKE